LEWVVLLHSFDQVQEFYHKICSGSSVLSHEALQIAVLGSVDVLYLARHGRAPLRLTATIGDRFPAALTAVGNALTLASHSR
jgi:DNA-binding IclR family transcriptional regulator